MSFQYTPSIFHEKPIWGPIRTKKIESEKSFKQEVFSILVRRVERYEEINEMDDILHEAHMERIGYIRELNSERKAIDREQRRRERREQKAQLRREKNEQRRREQKAEILRYTLEQRKMIRVQARLFRQMKRDEEEAAKQREIAEGWKVVTHKRSKKNIQRSSK
jgi:hypothetical protein